MAQKYKVFINDKAIFFNQFLELEKYFHDYIKLDAAGGVVQNSNGEILFIFRNEKWDLPKGKVENYEAIDEAALREVEEECGIDDLELKEHLITTYHTYEMFGKKHLKSTYWYRMKSNFTGEFTPQLEEDITKVEWKSLSELNDVSENTYQSIIDVLEMI